MYLNCQDKTEKVRLLCGILCGFHGYLGRTDHRTRTKGRMIDASRASNNLERAVCKITGCTVDDVERFLTIPVLLCTRMSETKFLGDALGSFH